MAPSRLPPGTILLLAAAAWAAAACGRPSPGPPVPEPGAPPEARPEPETPGQWYWAYVANRASDVVSRVRFGPGGAVYEKPVEVGVMPSETDAPLAVSVAPDGQHWYLATAAGPRAGRLYKYETGTDRRLASAELGASPVSVDLAPDGAEAWVAAAPTPEGAAGSSPGIAVLRTDSLRRVTRLDACSRPRGGGIVRSGDRVYVACAGGDLLVEVDAGDRRVRRALRLSPGREAVLPADRLRAGAGADGPPAGAPTCGPAALEAGDDRLWVTCAESGEVLEVAAGGLDVRRRIPVGPGPAGLAASPGGSLLVVANADGGSVSVIHLASGRELTRLETSRPRPRDVAVTDDGLYAFVSNESEGASRSTVDVFDLRALVRVAGVEVEHGAAGIAFWRSLPARRGDGGRRRR